MEPTIAGLIKLLDLYPHFEYETRPTAMIRWLVELLEAVMYNLRVIKMEAR